MIDFRIHYMSEGKPVWIKTKMFSEASEEEKYQANLRSIFPDEIVLDFESLPELETGKKKLLEEGISFTIARSPRGGHVHITFPELLKFSKSERNAIRSVFIQHYGADEAKSSEDTLISIPGKVHFKTKDFISTVENHVVGENTLPQYAMIGLCISPSVNITEILKGVKQGSRDSSAIKLATFHRINGKTQEEAEILLTEWNKKNEPPMSQSDIRAKTKSAYDKPKPYEWNFKTEEELFHLKLADDFIKENENICLEWIVDRLIPAGAIILCAGKRASFKSWIADKLALSISSGTDFFGCKTHKSPVILIDAENASFVLAQRLKSIGSDGVLLHIHCGEDFRFEVHDKKLLAKCKQLGTKLVIVDSMRRTHNADENDAAEVNELFREHLRQFKEAGITLLFLYHMRKGMGQGQIPDDPMDEIRGSSEFANLADMIYTISRCKNPSNQVVIRQVKNRLAAEVEPAQIEIDTASGTTKFNLISKGLQTVKTSDEICADSLLDLLKEREGKEITTKSLKELAESQGYSYRAFYSASKILINRGILAKEKRGQFYIIPQKEKLNQMEL